MYPYTDCWGSRGKVGLRNQKIPGSGIERVLAVVKVMETLGNKAGEVWLCKSETVGVQGTVDWSIKCIHGRDGLSKRSQQRKEIRNPVALRRSESVRKPGRKLETRHTHGEPWLLFPLGILSQCWSTNLHVFPSPKSQEKSSEISQK